MTSLSDDGGGSLDFILEEALSIKDFYEHYETWDSFIFVNKRDLIESVKRIHQKMIVFNDERVI